MLAKYIERAIREQCSFDGFVAEDLEVLPSNRPDLGQFQISASLSLAQTLHRAPRKIAEGIMSELAKVPGIINLRIDGPGFINFSVSDDMVLQHFGTWVSDPRCGVPVAPVAKRIIMDYGGPNVAKTMHVGHLRSAILGDTIRRIGIFLGHDVVSDVHLGDWGLPMGMVLGELIRQAGSETREALIPVLDHLTAEALNQIYPAAAARCRADKREMATARALTAKLQEGDALLSYMWKVIVQVTVKSVKEDFDDLNVVIDFWYGESRVSGEVRRLIVELKSKGIAIPSDGAMIIPLPESLPPILLEKSDGSMLYSSTDLATISDRIQSLNPDEIVYFTDQRQHLHFMQVFAAARIAGVASDTHPILDHVGFGTVNGEDGKPLKTRAGGVLKLRDLLDQAYQISRQRLTSIGLLDFTSADLDQAAWQLAVATIRIADLSHNRRSDYVFSMEHFSAAEGRTGPYLCYAYVRAATLLRKASANGATPGPIFSFSEPEERALLIHLIGFADVVQDSYEKRLPSLLCDHLFMLAQLFSSFYHKVRVLSEDDASRRGGLLTIVEAVNAELRLGLALLGVEPPEKM